MKLKRKVRPTSSRSRSFQTLRAVGLEVLERRLALAGDVLDVGILSGMDSGDEVVAKDAIVGDVDPADGVIKSDVFVSETSEDLGGKAESDLVDVAEGDDAGTDDGVVPIRFMFFGADTGTSVAGWQNQADPTDVNSDGVTSPLDALLIINDLNLVGSHSLATPDTQGDSLLAPGSSTEPFYYLDVSGDNYCSPQDVSIILNELNAPEADPQAGIAPIMGLMPISDAVNGSDPISDDTSLSDLDSDSDMSSSFPAFAMRIRPDDFTLPETVDSTDEKVWDDSLVDVVDELSDGLDTKVNFY